MNRGAFALGLLALSPAAHADDAWHGSIAAGGEALVTGADDHGRLRLAAAVEIAPAPWRRWAALLALRQVTLDGDRGLLTVGASYEAGAARPQLTLNLYVDAGLALEPVAPAVGAGVRLVVRAIGPVAIVVDVGPHLIVDGIDHSRLALSGALLLGLAR